MLEVGVRAGRKDVVDSACRRAGVGCSSVVVGLLLEQNEDPDRTGVYLAQGCGGVSVQGRSLWRLRVGARRRDLTGRRLAVVQSLRMPNWVHGALY